MDNNIRSEDYKGFLDALDHRILLGDGAMGTELQSRGVQGCPDAACIDGSSRDQVIRVHLDYLRAGSDIIQTNTFGANPEKLGTFGLEEKTEDINQAAVELAALAIRQYEKDSPRTKRHFIAGDVGPTGKLMRPSGSLDRDHVVQIFSRQVKALIQGGVDLLLIETMMDIDEALAAVEAARRVSSRIPVACTLSFGANGVTLMGNLAEESAGVLLDAGCHVIGANCSIGSDSMLGIVRKMRSARPEARLIFQPNAGLPSIVGGKTVYNETPEIMAENVRQYLAYNPSILGACCGSTPEHIRKLASLL